MVRQRRFFHKRKMILIVFQIYKCGGNLSIYFYDFKNYTFEEAYDQMVDVVNEYK